MLNVFELASQDTSLQRVAVNEYAGSCPVCGGSDRFHVRPTKNGENGGFMCRNCWQAESNGWGDSVSYLRHVRKMSFFEAKAYLSGKVEQTLDHVEQAQEQKQGSKFPDKPWIARSNELVDRAITALWQSKDMLAYLHDRGLTDSTIEEAKLGYAWQTIRVDEEYRNIPCLIIPWYVDGQLQYVNRRNMHEPIPDDEPKYTRLYGSSSNSLYLGYCLSTKRPAFLVESELDALSIWQEASDLVNVVATGGTSGSRTQKWKMRLARQPHVFVAFDSDSSGEKASTYWLDALENSTRYKPQAHDANDMLREGYDVRTWASVAGEYVDFNLLWAKGCCVCGKEPDHISEDGKRVFCEMHMVR